MKVSPLADKPVEPSMLVNIPRLVTAYYSEINILDQLISKRYNTSRKTIATTNYVTREIARTKVGTNEILEVWVGEHIASRLIELCELIHLEGRDYKKEMKKV